MCLLRNDPKDINCGHEECKGYYAANRQACLVKLDRNGLRPSSQSLLESNFFKIQQSLNAKRSLQLPNNQEYNIDGLNAINGANKKIKLGNYRKTIK